MPKPKPRWVREYDPPYTGDCDADRALFVAEALRRTPTTPPRATGKCRWLLIGLLLVVGFGIGAAGLIWLCSSIGHRELLWFLLPGWAWYLTHDLELPD